MNLTTERSYYLPRNRDHYLPGKNTTPKTKFSNELKSLIAALSVKSVAQPDLNIIIKQHSKNLIDFDHEISKYSDNKENIVPDQVKCGRVSPVCSIERMLTPNKSFVCKFIKYPSENVITLHRNNLECNNSNVSNNDIITTDRKRKKANRQIATPVRSSNSLRIPFNNITPVNKPSKNVPKYDYTIISSTFEENFYVSNTMKKFSIIRNEIKDITKNHVTDFESEISSLYARFDKLKESLDKYDEALKSAAMELNKMSWKALGGLSSFACEADAEKPIPEDKLMFNKSLELENFASDEEVDFIYDDELF